MPSLLDRLVSSDEADLTAPDPSGSLIDAVKAGRRRANRRRRRNLAVAVLALVLLAVPTAALRSADAGGQPEINVAAGGGGTITSEVITPVEPAEATATTGPGVAGPAWLPPPPPAAAPPMVTAPPPTAPPAGAAAATVTVATGPGPVSTPATAHVCRDSLEEACGGFRWDPAPSPNQPLVATFTKAPATAEVGQKVELEVAWSDGDARLTYQHVAVDSGMSKACDYLPRYGPWTPPVAVPSSGTLPLSHTFQEPGTYKVIASLGTSDCSSPYGDDKVIEHTVTVAPVAQAG